MRQKCSMILAVLILLLPGCGAKERDMPEPDQLVVMIQEAVTLPEMIDAGGNYLELLTGISPDSYDGAVCYLLAEGTAPDEIIIIHAKDASSAKTIQHLLENRLAYKAKSVERYFTEYQPVVQAGVVRRDGLTVSLIVSDQVSEITQVYENTNV